MTTRSIAPASKPGASHRVQLGTPGERRMRDQDAERRREPGGFVGPVGQERGRRHDQRRRLVVAARTGGEQREDLQRLAEAHVVCQAGAEPERRQQAQPANAGVLIRTERRAQPAVRLETGQALGATQAREHVAKPRPGRDLRPHPRLVGRGAVAVERCAGGEPHRFREGDATLGGRPLEPPEFVDHLLERLAADFHPLTAQEPQAVGARQQRVDLVGGERGAIQRDAHIEIEQRFRADTRRRLGPDRRGRPRARRPAAAPGRRQPHDHARRLQRRNILQELIRLGGGPPERMKDVAGVHHLLQPAARLGGALDRDEQRQEPGLVPGARILFERAPERRMQRLAPR